MQIKLDLDVLRVHAFTPDTYVYLNILYHGRIDLLDDLELTIDPTHLEDEGWIKQVPGSRSSGTMYYTLTSKATVTLFSNVDNHSSSLSDWIVKEFAKRNPERMSTPMLVNDKLRWFMNQYPSFTPTHIMAAVQYFLDKQTDPTFIPEAHNFVENKLYAYASIVSDPGFSNREFTSA